MESNLRIPNYFFGSESESSGSPQFPLFAMGAKGYQSPPHKDLGTSLYQSLLLSFWTGSQFLCYRTELWKDYQHVRVLLNTLHKGYNFTCTLRQLSCSGNKLVMNKSFLCFYFYLVYLKSLWIFLTVAYVWRMNPRYCRWKEPT